MVGSSALNDIPRTAGVGGRSPASACPCATRNWLRSRTSSARPWVPSSIRSALGYAGRASVASLTAVPIPGPTRIVLRHRAICAESCPPASRRSRVVTMWQPATTTRLSISRPDAVLVVQPCGRRTSEVTASPSVSSAPSRCSRAIIASVSAPLPPTARPGGRVCMRAANPTIGAVPGSDIGGPDCAPNHARAALSRSLENISSSRESPVARNSRESMLPPSGAPRPQKDRSSFGPVGGPPKARMVRSLRGPQTETKVR